MRKTFSEYVNDKAKNKTLKAEDIFPDKDIKTAMKQFNIFKSLRWEYTKKSLLFDLYSVPMYLMLMLITPIVSLFFLSFIVIYFYQSIGIDNMILLFSKNPLLLLSYGYSLMLIPVLVFMFIDIIISVFYYGAKKEKQLEKELNKKE